MARHIRHKIPKNIHAEPDTPKRIARGIVAVGALAGALAVLTYTQFNKMDAPRPVKTPSSIIGKESKAEFAGQAPLAEGIKMDAGTRDSGLKRVAGLDAGIDAGSPSFFDAGLFEERKEAESIDEVIPKKSGAIDLEKDDVLAAALEKEKKTKKGKKAKKRNRKAQRQERKQLVQKMMEMEARINGKSGIPWGQFYTEYAHMRAAEVGEVAEFEARKAEIAKEKKARAAKKKEQEKLRKEMAEMLARNEVKIDVNGSSPPPKTKKATPGESIDYVPLNRPVQPKKEYPQGSTPYD